MAQAPEYYFAFAAGDPGRCVLVRCPTPEAAARARDDLRKTGSLHVGYCKTPFTEAAAVAFARRLGWPRVGVFDMRGAPAPAAS